MVETKESGKRFVRVKDSSGNVWLCPLEAMKKASDATQEELDDCVELDVVWQDHDIPSIAMHTWYHVGSRNERPGITGISHFFEHMMFNGTKTRPPGEFDRVMEANGGSNNAYTSSDVTVYMNWFPTTTTELIFELESDRMRNLDFDPQAVESERGVVSSERRSRLDDDNFGTLYEQMQATAFVAHPYQAPFIGWPSDIAGWKVDDLQAYYERYYAPNNAVMFVEIGDGFGFTPNGVRLWAAFDDNLLLRWDAVTGAAVGKAIPGVAAGEDILPSPDGRTLMLATADRRTLRLWDVDTGEPRSRTGGDGSADEPPARVQP